MVRIFLVHSISIEPEKYGNGNNHNV